MEAHCRRGKRLSACRSPMHVNKSSFSSEPEPARIANEAHRISNQPQVHEGGGRASVHLRLKVSGRVAEFPVYPVCPVCP
jgi:hypothetical protein